MKTHGGEKMRTKKEEFQFMKLSIADFLKRIREEVGYSSPFMVAKELFLGQDSIYKIEKGESVPTRATLNRLIKVYRMNQAEIKEITEMCDKAREIRKQVTRERLTYGR